MPPVAAVYVKVTVRPVWLADTALVGVVSVPEPSAALTVIVGELARSEQRHAAREFCCADHAGAPVVDVTVAPGPPLPLSPYVIVIVAPPASVTLETVIV